MENKTLGLFFSSSNWILACLIPRLSKVRPSDERANVWNSCKKNDRLGGTTGRVMFTWQTLERAVRKHKSGNLGLRLCAEGNPTQLLLEVGRAFTWILNFGEFPCSELAFYPNAMKTHFFGYGGVCRLIRPPPVSCDETLNRETGAWDCVRTGTNQATRWRKWQSPVVVGKWKQQPVSK